MTTADRGSELVLFWSASATDAEVACRTLSEHDVEARSCASLDAVCGALAEEVGALVLSEELLTAPAIERLGALLSAQAPWSDLPVLVASGRHVRRVSSAALHPLGNVTLLDTPLRLRTLVQATKAALRARRRQYAARGAIRRRDQFLAMLGHELRNPLSSIALAGEQLEGERGAADPTVAVLRRQTRQLTRLVDDLLDVARVTTGKLQLKLAPLDLSRALGQWIEAWRPRFEGAGVTLELEREAALRVRADAARLEQAIGNLLTNCVKYTPRGGNVRVTASAEGGWVTVRVADDGVGMDSSVLSSVFDEFMQVEGSLDRAQGGMGVGLTLVRSLIERHGGSVEARSEGLGRGSELIVRLPALEPEASGEDADAEEAPSPTPTRRIALVEDNDDTREMMELALTRRGHRVVSAPDGPSGLALVLEERPDAAVIDIGLPGLSGYEVASAVRRELGASIALVAASGYGQEADRRRAREAGFDRHLTKPVRPDEILREIERLLASR